METHMCLPKTFPKDVKNEEIYVWENPQRFTGIISDMIYSIKKLANSLPRLIKYTIDYVINNLPSKQENPL